MTTFDEITRFSQQISALVTARDAAGIAAKWTDDGVLLPPAAPPVRGRAGILQHWQTQFAEGLQSLAIETLEVDDLGDTAIELTALYWQAQVDGQRIEGRGKALVIYRRGMDGIWRARRTVYNADT